MYEIEIKNVTLTIKNKTILDNVSLNIEKGTIHALVGENGSGKTMLMKCVSGFVHPKGEITVKGQRVGKDVDFPDSMGIIIETPGFIPYYSGYKNLEYLASIKNKISAEEITRVLEKVGLKDEAKKRVGKYSLGQRQRLGIAQALMEDPDILILDEPMNALDHKGVLLVRELILELKEKGKTVLLTSHNSEDIDLLADSITYMENGRITEKQP
ncbi:MAG: ATP-binding cassette domain-containing protein [Clostridia bacterium]|nr:ATP-binding cassette domain-containing protein [Clostridia bacterium]